MELDRALGHQEPHWKEFRFDLTQIPAGEVVTAAEFRIYKLPSTHPLNRTLHVSMFEVVREQANRCLPCAPALVKPVGVSGPALRGTFPRGQKGSFLGAHPQRRGMLGLRPGTLGRGPVPVVASSPCPAVPAVEPRTSRLWNLERAIELPAYFPICPRHSNTSLRQIQREEAHEAPSPEPGG